MALVKDDVVQALRELLQSDGFLPDSASDVVRVATSEIHRLRTNMTNDVIKLQRLDEALRFRHDEVQQLNEKLRLRTDERDRARREWYAWMKLAVSQSLSLGTEHMPNVADVPPGK